MVKIYLSSLSIEIANHLGELFPDKPLNILRSFGVESNEDYAIINGAIPKLGSHILDCGTFSLNFANNVDDEKVSIEGYIAYLKHFKKHYDFYFSFDRNFTIYGAKENLKCLQQLRDAGLEPVPVIHDYYRGEVQFYIDHGYKFVALGSIMEKGKNKMLRKQKHINFAVEQLYQAGVDVHLFGKSSFKSIAYLPLYSCDSSSWAQNNKFGFILYWNPEKEGEDKTDKLFFYEKLSDYYSDRKYYNQYDFRPQFERYLEGLGITYLDLIGNRKHYYRQLVNAIYYITIQDEVAKIHKQLGFTH